jgi:DNA-binding Xre family transcriptional regulator
MVTLRASDKGLKTIDRLRIKKGWSRREKAWYDLAYTSESTLRRFWEKQPISHENFVNICTAIEANWEDIVDDTESSPSSTTCHNIPYMGAIKFVGRQTQLETLHEKLQQQDKIAIVAVAGMGGLGKTELAVQYAYQHLTDYPSGICWLDGRAEQDIWEQIIYFVQINLGLEVPQEIGEKQLNFKQQVDWCWQNWKGSGSVLVVIDDVGEFPKIQPYLPPGKSRFKVLMTTRLKLPNIKTLSLDVLSLEASLELLESDHLVGRERIEQEPEIANTLCEWLGYLPLGLELVGRYLNQVPTLSLSLMLFRLQEKSLKHQSVIRKQNDLSWDLTAQRGVAAAFELSWEKLDEDGKKLGKLLSLFGSSLIPWHLVESVEQKRCQLSSLIPWHLVESVEQKRCQLSSKGEEFSSEKLEEATINLIGFHLIQYNGEQNYRLHSLIREFFKSKLEE